MSYDFTVTARTPPAVQRRVGDPPVEDAGEESRAEMRAWCVGKVCNISMRRSFSRHCIDVFEFKSPKDATDFAARFKEWVVTNVDSIDDLDAARVKRAVDHLIKEPGYSLEPNALEAAQRLKERHPDHPALKSLAAALNVRDFNGV